MAGHDESTCPLTLLFGHPFFLRAYVPTCLRAYVEMTVEENWPPERLSELVLDLLAASLLSVTDEMRAKVSDCSDPEQLRSWAVRALSADGPEELFADDVD
ncbi:MAG: hypothetical protein HOZ81_31225 [Streptomyces sp.]|nr:hypothetical protein [Streptomyces sp.]